MAGAAEHALRLLSSDVRDFWSSAAVPRVQRMSPMQFLRDFVSQNKPVIIGGLIDHWPAREKWSLDYFERHITQQISVNLTPDGRADSAKTVDGQEAFVYPAEASMSFSEFRQLLEQRNQPNGTDLPEGCVPYISHQNDSMRQQFEEVIQDIEASIPMGDEVFGDQPEAVNLWLGDERSVSSTHKDHYENLYCVVQGEKTFTLFPPADIAFLPEQTLPTFEYKARRRAGSSDGFTFELEAAAPPHSKRWICLEPEGDDVLQRYPRFKYAHPLRCTVAAGETLYLPALWYHRVSQTCTTIAVNYWYNMQFNHTFVLYQLVRSLVYPGHDSYREKQESDSAVELET